MRFIVLAPDIEDSDYRGIQMIFFDLIKALKNLGHQVDLVVSYPIDPLAKIKGVVGSKMADIYLRHYLHGNDKRSSLGRVNGLLGQIRAMVAMIFPRVAVYGLSKNEFRRDIPWLNYVDKIIQVPYIYKYIRAGYAGCVARLLKKIAKVEDFDAVLTVSPTYLPNLKKHFTVVQFVHDVIPLELSEDAFSRRGIALFGKSFQQTSLLSDLILVNSEDTKQKILAVNADANVQVVFASVSDFGDIIDSDDVAKDLLKLWGLKSGKYLFFVAMLEKRKNLERLLDAYIVVADRIDMDLVIAGKPGYEYEKLQKKFAALPSSVRRRIHFIGYVTSLQKRSLMECAFAFVFPTLYEGIGLPVLEAMNSGCPVITSRVGGLPEVAGDAALYIDNPYSISEIAGRILQLSKDVELRNTLIKRGKVQSRLFSVDAFSQRLSTAIKSIES